MLPSPEDLARHVAELAAAFRVRLQVVPGLPVERAAAGTVRNPRKPYAAQRRVAMIAPVTDDTSYAVALHELGHCVAPMGMMLQTEGSRMFKVTGRYATLRDVRLKLEEEQAAWAWARHHALDWTVAMDMVERFSLDAYRKDARRYGVKETNQ